MILIQPHRQPPPCCSVSNRHLLPCQLWTIHLESLPHGDLAPETATIKIQRKSTDHIIRISTSWFCYKEVPTFWRKPFVNPKCWRENKEHEETNTNKGSCRGLHCSVFIGASIQFLFLLPSSLPGKGSMDTRLQQAKSNKIKVKVRSPQNSWLQKLHKTTKSHSWGMRNDINN